MKRITLLFIAFFILTGCSVEKGDKPLARGKGFGYEWTCPNPKEVLRVSVQNSFTRDSFLVIEGEDRHYELKVGPIRDGFIVVPKGSYKYSAWSFGDSVGNTRYKVTQDDRNGISGVLVRIR